MSTVAMNLTTIDTLAFSKRMQKAGLEQRAADELAEAINEARSQSIEGLATKQYIKEIKQEIELMKKYIVIKLGSLLAIGIGIIVALIKI